MEEIRELVLKYDPKRHGKIDLFDYSNESRESQMLFDLIKSNPSISEKKAMEELRKDRENYKFSKTKSYLFKRLSNSFLFLKYPRKKKNIRNEHLLQLTFDYVKMINLQNHLAKKAICEIGEKAIKKAIKYEHVELVYLISNILKFNYGIILPNKTKYAYYLELSQLFEQKLIHQNKAENLYIKYSALDNNSKSSLQSLISSLKFDLVDLEEIHKKFPTERSSYIYFRLKLYFHFLQKEYETCLKICDKALENINSKVYKDNFGNYSFTSAKVPSSLNLGYYNLAKKNILESLSYINNDSVNYSKTMNFYFIHSILTKDYVKAFEIINETSKNQYINGVPSLKEKWNIRKAYMVFLKNLGKINSHPFEEKEKFRINKFLNEVPIFSKQKQGQNIPIIISQLLFYLLNRKYNKYIDRIDSLKQYTRRYLKNDENLRSHCFMNMLIKIPSCTFHPIRVTRHTELFTNKLKTTKFELKAETRSTEIIPYETLWEYVLEILEKNLKK